MCVWQERILRKKQEFSRIERDIEQMVELQEERERERELVREQSESESESEEAKPQVETSAAPTGKQTQPSHRRSSITGTTFCSSLR